MVLNQSSTLNMYPHNVFFCALVKELQIMRFVCIPIHRLIYFSVTRSSDNLHIVFHVSLIFRNRPQRPYVSSQGLHGANTLQSQYLTRLVKYIERERERERDRVKERVLSLSLSLSLSNTNNC